MRNALKILILVLVLGFCLVPLVVYSITIEEFIKKHPHAVVALSANYYQNGYIEVPTMNSGLSSRDPYGTSMKNVIEVRDLYNSGIEIPSSTWDAIIKQTDDWLDIACSNGARVSKEYGDLYLDQEQTRIPEKTGYEMIIKLFSSSYDGMSIETLESLNPVFFLQVSLERRIHIDSSTNDRNKDSDPTPPIYGDGQ